MGSAKSGVSSGNSAPVVPGWPPPTPPPPPSSRPSLQQQSAGGLSRSSGPALKRSEAVGRRASVVQQTSLADKFFGFDARAVRKGRDLLPPFVIHPNSKGCEALLPALVGLVAALTGVQSALVL